MSVHQFMSPVVDRSRRIDRLCDRWHEAVLAEFPDGYDDADERRAVMTGAAAMIGQFAALVRLGEGDTAARRLLDEMRSVAERRMRAMTDPA